MRLGFLVLIGREGPLRLLFKRQTVLESDIDLHLLVIGLLSFRVATHGH